MTSIDNTEWEQIAKILAGKCNDLSHRVHDLEEIEADHRIMNGALRQQNIKLHKIIESIQDALVELEE